MTLVSRVKKEVIARHGKGFALTSLGIISAILVSLGTSLDGRETSSNEKELITSLCSGGAFFGCILAGLTADKVSDHQIFINIQEF